MDDDGGLGIRNWGYYDPPMKRNLGLQLMSTVVDRDDTKPFLSNAGFLHHHHPEPPSLPMEFMRDGWIHHSRESKLLHVMPLGHHHSNYGIPLPSKPAAMHTLQMLHPPDPVEDVETTPRPLSDELKRRPEGCPNKQPKLKKPKKAVAPGDESAMRAKAGKKSTSLVINGIDLDISGIPTPVCTCTGTPQQCYRWGVGGWQSACCTTNMSMHPLPMSTKRRGARIAGRKMSQGAFKKVLEKLAGEGHNLSNAIDLKTFWAKHGTNKFVVIR